MQTNGRQLSVFDGQTSNAVRSGAETCSHSTSPTWTSVVKDVKVTGDPKGIIDAVGRRQSAWRRRLRKGAFVPLRRAVCHALGGQSEVTNTRKGGPESALVRGNSLPRFQEKVAQNLHSYGGTRYPAFSSANLTCRRNGGVKPAICHSCQTLVPAVATRHC